MTTTPDWSERRSPTTADRIRGSTQTGGRPRLLLALHVLTVSAVFGGDIALALLGLTAVLDPSRGIAIYSAMNLIATYLIVPLAFAALASGVLLTLIKGTGLVRYAWIGIKLFVTTGLAMAALLVLGPGLDNAESTALAVSGAFPDTLRLRFALIPAVAALLVAMNVALSIWKPASWLLWRHFTTRQSVS